MGRIWPLFLVLSFACSEGGEALDGGPGPSDAATGADASGADASPDASVADADLADGAPPDGGTRDAAATDAASEDVGPFALCAANATGLEGTVDGQAYQYSTTVERLGLGSARMGHLGLARWFDGGFAYFSSATPLGDPPTAVSAILALPPTRGSTTAIFYCSTTGSARFYDAQPMDARLEASITHLSRLGGCPGLAGPVADRLVLCVNAPFAVGCDDGNGTPQGNWLAGRLGAETLAEPSALIDLRARGSSLLGLFRGGRAALRLDQGPLGLSGYLLMRGPGALDPTVVYCVNATPNGQLPGLALNVDVVGRLEACGAQPDVAELSLCSE